MITRNTLDDYCMDCDGCGIVGPFSLNLHLLMGYARRRRWHTKDDRHYCPACWAKRKKR